MDEQSAPSPATDPTILMPRVIRYCLTEGEAADLALDSRFMLSVFRQEQIVRLKEFTEITCNRTLSTKSLSQAFDVNREIIRRALARGYAIPCSRGRHPAFDEETELALVDWIKGKAENQKAVTRTELLHHCMEMNMVPVSRGWVDSFLSRHSQELFEAKSCPQENPRLEVPQAFLDTAIECLKEHVQGACAELVFNLDEVGISEWEDRVERKVIVPRSMQGELIHHAVHRNLKHVSVVACISAAGESMTPFFVSSQATPAVTTKLKCLGFRMGVDLVLKHRSKPYVSSKLFYKYLTKVFLPYIEELRTNREFADKVAILLMDNCSVHVSADVISVLTEHRVKVITWPPHTTHIFQVLDLSLFGVFKRKMSYKLPFEDEDGTAGFLKRIFHNLKQTLVETNIRSAFIMLGLTYDIRQTPYSLLFNERKLRESVGFRELWDRDYPMSLLSTRRQNAKFGWVNEEEFRRMQ
jgi:hypothetical protein